jgi:hypothetical protein
MGKNTVTDLLNSFEASQSDDTDMAHFYANGLVIQNLRTRLSLSNSKWESIELSKIQDVARQLLTEDTMKLKE